MMRDTVGADRKTVLGVAHRVHDQIILLYAYTLRTCRDIVCVCVFVFKNKTKIVNSDKIRRWTYGGVVVCLLVWLRVE